MGDENLHNDYVRELIKAIDVRAEVAFYGVLKGVNPENLILFPYLAYKANENGQYYATLVSKGKPLLLNRTRISALHPIDKEELSIIIENSKRNSDINAMKLRLEGITTRLNLADMEEAEIKRKRRE